MEFPHQVIVMDRELGKRHPGKGFYLRVVVENGADHVVLDEAISPLDARKIAKAMGYDPSHWMVVGDASLIAF